MSVGRWARRALGERWFPLVGAWYRSLFVNLEKVADSVPPVPGDANILDVGGGDGAVLNVVLGRHPAARAVMIDLGASIGSSLAPDRASRVRLLPQTSMNDYGRLGMERPDLIIISDVLHHVPVAERRTFFSDLRALIAGGATTIFFKDVEPGSWRATAGYLADRYVSGDRRVELVGQVAVRALLEEAFPGATFQPTDLFRRDPPNYALTCRVG